ncbi:MAG: MbnP family protein [Bacteroidota bacterium]
MRKILFRLLCLSLFVVSLSSCEKDKEGTLELNFKLMYDGQPLAMFDKHQYPDGSSIFFDRFNLFLSNSSLMKEGGKEFAFDVQLLNFSDIQDVDEAQKGLTVSLGAFPSGSYEGLEMGIGIAPELNKTTPGDHSSSHPLANHYWEQWSSYIFMTIEGKADVSGDGKHDLILTYHIGKDEAFSSKQYQTPFEIEGGKKTVLEMQIDLLDMMSDDNEYLDIQATPIDHSTDPEVYEFFYKNMPNAIKVNS